MKRLFVISTIVLASLASSAVFAQTPAPNATGIVTITRTDAEALALKQNPRITASRLLALAAGQVTREARSAELPQIDGNLTAEKAEDGSRIGAGSLTSSRLYTKAGVGGTLSQLVTDFGHTSNLVASAKLQQRAQDQSTLATQQDILLATDQAFYRLAEAQALLTVAKQTVAARGNVRDLTQALTNSKLKSDLDLNFAAADYSQAQLLELDAQTDTESASAALAALLAAPSGTHYIATEDASVAPPLPPENADVLTASAMTQRPDLAALRLGVESQTAYARAQKDQYFPSVNVLAIGGATPVRPDGVFVPNWYGAAGINISVPLFTGFRIGAQAKEAQLRAQAQTQQAADLSNTIARDVRTATLAAQAAFQRITVTEAFRAQAAQALSLAQTRYKLGLSSIVELSQAQLQGTQADVASVNARFSYLLALRSLDYTTGGIH